MNALIRKRKNQKHLGVVKAAKVLGCTYSHLVRCLKGQRNSWALYSRYLDLKNSGKIPGLKDYPYPRVINPNLEMTASENSQKS